MQATLGKLVWPTPTNAKNGDMFCPSWRPVSEIIDWSQPKKPLSGRARALNPKTLDKVIDGVLRFWGDDTCEPFIARFNSGNNRVHSIHNPLPVLDCSNRYALVEPLLYGYYGNATFTPVSRPCPTLTCKDRFALIEPILERNRVADISFRMLTVPEIQMAQSFPSDYEFCGNRADKVKQIGNAVPPKVAEALVGGIF